MAGKGGNAPRRKGARFEVRVAADQRRMGRWCERIRQGQGEIVDLIALERCTDGRRRRGSSHAYMIQCRVTGEITDAEEEKLAAEAYEVSATPLLAWEHGKAIQYREL